MNNKEKIKQHIVDYCVANDWEVPTVDEEFLEIITETDQVYSEIGSSHRWYDDEFVVVEINGMLIGYDSYHITGDNSMFDMGLSHSMDQVYEVEKKEVIKTDYVIKH